MLPVLAAGAAAASSLGSLVQPFVQGRMNRKNRQFAEKMYNQQRTDALDFWRMQNEYNTPAQQMARFKAAGLNPNLIYGQGNAGNAGAANVPSQAHWSGTAPNIARATGALSSSVSAYVDYRLKSAQLNNLGAQNDLIRQQAAQTAANTAKVGIDTARSKFDLGLASDLRQTSLDAARESLRKQQIGNDVALQANERAAASNALSLKEGAMRILTMRKQNARTDADIKRIGADIERIRSSTKLNQLDIDLKRLGFQPGDELWQRILGRLLNWGYRNSDKIPIPGLWRPSKE